MQNKNFLTKTRWLVTIILLLSFGIPRALAADIVIDLDLSDAKTYPVGFPTATGTTSGTHTLGGYSFSFSCNTGYYKGSSNAYLMIGACSTTEATASIITFPAIENYKLTEVKLTTTSGGSTALSLWIGTSFSSSVSGGGAWTYVQSTTKTWTLSGTEAKTAYKLYVKRSGSSGTKNCQIEGLKLTYEATASCGSDPTVTAASNNGSFL